MNDFMQIEHDLFHDINNGVYKTGSASTQESHVDAYDALFPHRRRVSRAGSGRPPWRPTRRIPLRRHRYRPSRR